MTANETAGAGTAGPAGAGPLPSYADLPIRPGLPAGSSWGVWGDDDRFGCGVRFRRRRSGVVHWWTRGVVDRNRVEPFGFRCSFRERDDRRDTGRKIVGGVGG